MFSKMFACLVMVYMAVAVMFSLVAVVEKRAEDILRYKESGVTEFWLNVWSEAERGYTFHYYGYEIVPRRDGALLIRKEKEWKK